MIQKANRHIFIGDIHGCYNELMLLLKKLSIHKEDKVFFVGDLIFKGPKSLKVLKYIYKNRTQFSMVNGNKEYELLNALESKKYDNIEEKKLCQKLKKKYPEIISYLKQNPYKIIDDSFILVHAGLTPGKDIDKQTPQELCYIREYLGKPWYSYYPGSKKVIYGHWAIDGLKIRNNTVGLDSGCVYGGKLTAYILETGEIVQENSLKIHKNPYKKSDVKYYLKYISFYFLKIFTGK